MKIQVRGNGLLGDLSYSSDEETVAVQDSSLPTTKTDSLLDVKQQDSFPTSPRSLDRFHVDLPEAVSSMIRQPNLEEDSPEVVIQPTEFDVMCGRGKGAYLHAGNLRAREIVNQCLHMYLKAKSKFEKTIALGEIVDRVRSQNNGTARFLKRHKGAWYEIPEEQAREKIGHLAREATRSLAAAGKISPPVSPPVVLRTTLPKASPRRTSRPKGRRATQPPKKMGQLVKDVNKKQATTVEGSQAAPIEVSPPPTPPLCRTALPEGRRPVRRQSHHEKSEHEKAKDQLWCKSFFLTPTGGADESSLDGGAIGNTPARRWSLPPEIFLPNLVLGSGSQLPVLLPDPNPTEEF